MAKKPTKEQCMAYANELLKQQTQVDALVAAGLSTGNRESDYVKASRLIRNDKVIERIERLQQNAQKQIMANNMSVVNEYLSLLDDPEATLKDKIAIWKEIGNLLGLYKTITENTNHNDLTPEHEQLLQEINAKLHPKTDNS